MGLSRLLLVAVCVLVAGAARADDDEPGQAIYRYKGRDGRVVFTNLAEQIPTAERERARVDLRRVELNTETGRELEQRVAEEYRALRATPACQRLVAEADAPFLRTLWDEFAPLVVCGGMLLLLFVGTPAALRRFSAPDWAKVLMTAIPALAFAGLSMFAMTSTSRVVDDLKQRAAPCKPETFERLAGAPDALHKQVELLDQLRREAQN